MLVWHGGEEHVPQFQMALGWGGGWAPLSSSGTCEAELRAPLSPAFTGQAGTRKRRVVPLLWDRSARQQDIRHRACRINTHPLCTPHFLYVSMPFRHCSSKSIFKLPPLLHRPEDSGSLTPARLGVLLSHPPQGASCPPQGMAGTQPSDGCEVQGELWVGRTSLFSPGSGHSRHSILGCLAVFVLHLCCCEPAAGTRVPLQSVSSHCIKWDVSFAQGLQLKEGK